MARKVFAMLRDDKTSVWEGGTINLTEKETSHNKPPEKFGWNKRATFRRFFGKYKDQTIEVVIWEGTEKKREANNV